MFEIEVDRIQVCTCRISDEDENKIKAYINNNPEKFDFMTNEEAIIKAVSELDINLYNDYVESDGYTNDIRWSEFEDRSADNILGKDTPIKIQEINIFVTNEFADAEENGDDISIRVYLSNEDSIEIWFDKESDCYTWSNATYGYEDTNAVISDILEWMEDNNLFVTNMEVI